MSKCLHAVSFECLYGRGAYIALDHVQKKNIRHLIYTHTLLMSVGGLCHVLYSLCWVRSCGRSCALFLSFPPESGYVDVWMLKMNFKPLLGATVFWNYTATHCNTLQHTAIHCNTLHTHLIPEVWSNCVCSDGVFNLYGMSPSNV